MPNDRPNVLFVISDEHSYRAQSRLDPEGEGYPVRTPALDDLARNGATFERAYCPMPLCAPSRLCMLTGRNVRGAGAWENGSVLRPDAETLPGTLSAAGYETCLVGKMHLAGSRQFAGFDHRPYGDITGRAGHQLEPAPLYDGWSARNRTTETEVTDIPESLLQERTVVDESVAFVREHAHANPDRPWFLCASLARPHYPFNVPRRFVDRYWPDGVTPPKEPDGGDAHDHPMTRALREFASLDDIDEDERARARAAYFACVDFIDEIVGDLLGTLERDGLLENTIVVYASDHGELAGERGLWFKRAWHEESVRVPLTIQTPAHRRGERDAASIETPVSLIDLYPTLCGLGGVDAPDDLDGVDLSASVERGTEPERGPVFVDNLAPQWGEETAYRAVIDGDYKYVGFRDAPELLFDLDADPHEQRNLAPDAGGADAAALSRLRELVAETMDFDAADRERERDAALREEYELEESLANPGGPGNAYLMAGRLVIDADAPLHEPRLLTDDAPSAFDDYDGEE